MNKIKNTFTNLEEATKYALSAEYQPFFQQKYEQIIKQDLMKEFQIANAHNVPKVYEIWLSCALSNLRHDQKLLYKIFNAIYLIGGVKPVYTRCSRSISQFKIYQKLPIGIKAKLSGHIMYEFLERFAHIYLPNIKNFIGIKECSISNNTISIGIKDMSVIKEVSQYIGMLNIGFTVTIILKNAKEVSKAAYLLKAFNIPIKKDI